MKKGQVQGQVFIYVLTLIITGMILIYGYNAIKSINENANQVELANFKTTIKSDFEKMSSDYGSVKTMSYNVPSKLKEVCFNNSSFTKGANCFFNFSSSPPTMTKP